MHGHIRDRKEIPNDVKFLTLHFCYTEAYRSETVVLTHMTIRNSEFTDSSTVKLLHTNSLVCDSEISTQKFRSAIVVDLMLQKGLENLQICVQNTALLKCVKLCPRVFLKYPQVPSKP